MLEATIPDSELQRIEAARRLGLADDKPESRFDAITKEATEKLGMPISTLTIFDPMKERYKSCQGLDQKDAPRAISFCAHALLKRDMFIIPDTAKDPRFANNPMVLGKPFIRSYMGMALFDHQTGLPVAVLCVKDVEPHEFSLEEIDAFSQIATRAEEEINRVR